MTELARRGGWTPKPQRGEIERLDLPRRQRRSPAWDVLMPPEPGHNTPIFDALAGHNRWTVPNELARLSYLHSKARIEEDHRTWPRLGEATA